MKNKFRLTEKQLIRILGEEILAGLKEFNLLKEKTKNNDIQNFLNSLNEKEFKQIWIDYRSLDNSPSYDNPLSIEMVSSKLNEGLIKSYPIDKVISYVKAYFQLDDKQIKKLERSNGVEEIIIYVPDIGDNIELIKKAMTLCGYHLGHTISSKKSDKELIRLQFEPSFQENYSEELRKEEKFLYHLTPSYNVRSIQKIGLTPKHKNELFKYPSRIYLLRGSLTDAEIKGIGQQLNKHNSSKGNDGKYTLIVLDLEKIPFDVNFYLDPNFVDGCYTTQNIPPNAIVGIQEYQF